MENNLLDTSGNGNNGTVGAGSAAYVRGKVGQAADFNPTGFQRMVTPLRLGGNVGNVYSISAWVRLDAYIRGYLVNQTDGQTNGRFVLESNGIDGLALFAGKVVGGVYQIAIGEWSHHVITLNNQGTYNWYINGSLFVSEPNCVPPPQVNAINQGALWLEFGGAGPNRVIPVRDTNSALDDVQIWNRALQPHHIRAIYNGVDPAFIGDVA
jgi:hypothetical protein